MDAVLASSTIWEDVLALHICPLLGVADLSALRRTCKALRLLVSERLPDTTWKSVAHNSLPAKHRLLLLPGSEVKGYLERVARAKQNLPEPTSLRESTDSISDKQALSLPAKCCACLTLGVL